MLHKSNLSIITLFLSTYIFGSDETTIPHPLPDASIDQAGIAKYIKISHLLVPEPESFYSTVVVSTVRISASSADLMLI